MSIYGPPYLTPQERQEHAAGRALARLRLRRTVWQQAARRPARYTEIMHAYLAAAGHITALCLIASALIVLSDRL